MAARLIELCDAVAQAIKTAWNPASPNGVERKYRPVLNLTEDARPPHAGRRVYVFPGPVSSTQIARDTQWRAYTVRVLTVEKFEDGAGPVPDAWVDERMEFVQDKVFNILANDSLKVLGEMTPSPDEPPAWELPYDGDVLEQHRTFWSMCRLHFVEPATLAGVPPS